MIFYYSIVGMFLPLLCSMMFYSQCYKNWRIEKSRKIWWKGTQNITKPTHRRPEYGLLKTHHSSLSSPGTGQPEKKGPNHEFHVVCCKASCSNLIDMYRSIYNNLYIQIWDQPPSWNFSHHCLHVRLSHTVWTFTNSLAKKKTKHHCKF